MEQACRFLGHPHILTQTVSHGRQIGRSIGIPTANLLPPSGLLLPACGVYTAQVSLPDGRQYNSIVNIGRRPTVNSGSDMTIECHLLDFNEDLYGLRLRVLFRQRLRGEIRFASLEQLRQQILQDIADARTRLTAPADGLF